MGKCEKCKEDKVNEKVEAYSKQNFNGKVYCFECQKKIREIGVEAPPVPEVEEQMDIQEEVIEDPIDIKKYDPAFLGMIFNQSMINAREYEPTYEDVKRNIGKYFNDCLRIAIKLMKK